MNGQTARVSRDFLLKLWAIELFVLVGTVIGVFYTIDAGVLSMIEGLAVFAVVLVGEALLDAHVTG